MTDRQKPFLNAALRRTSECWLLRPTIRVFRGDDAPRRSRSAAIAEQGKAGRSRTRHSRQLRPSGDQGQSFEHRGDRRSHPDRRRFEIVTALETRKSQKRIASYPVPAKRMARATSDVDPGASPSAAKTFGVGARTWGLTRSGKQFSAAESLGRARSPIPLMIRAWGERQARTSAPVARAEAMHSRIVDRQSCLLGEQPQSRRRIRTSLRQVRPRRAIA